MRFKGMKHLDQQLSPTHDWTWRTSVLLLRHLITIGTDSRSKWHHKWRIAAIRFPIDITGPVGKVNNWHLWVYYLTIYDFFHVFSHLQSKLLSWLPTNRCLNQTITLSINEAIQCQFQHVKKPHSIYPSSHALWLFFCPSSPQVAVKRRRTAWIQSCTHWKRQRFVPVMSFCHSPLGIGLLASSPIPQPQDP